MLLCLLQKLLKNVKMFKEVEMNYALVTGATGVLGTSFCRELAQRGFNLYLTGRSPDKLSALVNELVEKYPSVGFRIFAADLTKEEDRRALFSDASGYSFDLLVNVAGADIQKPFLKYDEEKIIFQNRINFEAAVSLCNFALKHRAGKLKIINICSVCGLQPMPNFALYSACKSALIDFSVALAVETKRENVKVTAIIPGSIYTRQDVKAYIERMGFWAKMAAKSPEYVVKKSLKASEKGRRRKIVGTLNKLIIIFSKFVPEPIKLKYIAKSRKNLEKDVF